MLGNMKVFRETFRRTYEEMDQICRQSPGYWKELEDEGRTPSLFVMVRVLLSIMKSGDNYIISYNRDDLEDVNRQLIEAREANLTLLDDCVNPDDIKIHDDIDRKLDSIQSKIQKSR